MQGEKAQFCHCLGPDISPVNKPRRRNHGLRRAKQGFCTPITDQDRLIRSDKHIIGGFADPETVGQNPHRPHIALHVH